MNGTGVALRYATALYEVADESGEGDAVARDMVTLRTIFGEVPGLTAYCGRAGVTLDDAVAMTQTAFVPYVSEITAQTLLTAVRNGRLEALPLLAAAYDRVAASRSEALSVTLETAVPASDETISVVEARMRERTGKPVAVRARVVPEILAGMRVRWMDRVIDLSAATRVKRLRSYLTGTKESGTQYGA